MPKDILLDIKGASWAPQPVAEAPVANGKAKPAARPGQGAIALCHPRAALRADDEPRAYRVRGHLEAGAGPAGPGSARNTQSWTPPPTALGRMVPDRPIYLDKVLGLEYATLREIMAILRETYCGHVGVEFMHIQDPAQKAWIQQRVEGGRNRIDLSAEDKEILQVIHGRRDL